MNNNISLGRRAAADGIVLIKNDDNCLPFTKGERVALVGKDCYNLIKNGGGSAEVYSPYVRNLADGLSSKTDKIVISNVAEALAHNSNTFENSQIDAVGKDCDCVIVSIGRRSSEGGDRKSDSLYLYNEEKVLFEQLENNNFVKKIVVVLNIPTVMNFTWLSDYSKIKAALIVWFPGMDGGDAVADILCGDVCPSGRLADTAVKDYCDYPSSDSFAHSGTYNYYDEDIYVGYRYFETFENAKEKVVFPFGYGLSYTEFSFDNVKITRTDSDIVAKTTITNVGKTAGRQVAFLFCSAPKGMISKPKYELKAFAKTKLLAPTESETVEMRFPISLLSSFDELGVIGEKGSYVIEKGDYNFYIGENIRKTLSADVISFENDVVIATYGLKFTSPLIQRLTENGYVEKSENTVSSNSDNVKKSDSVIMLKDVAEGRYTYKDFISQLSDEELIALSYSQPPEFPRGTAGIGNMKKYGVPNAQTADGPNGLRRTVPSTCFPCATALACSFDEELIFDVGAAISREGCESNIDILLAPGLNIHRDPLNGRNFEYYSEDPIVSGRSAAAYVRGVQSEGMLSTVKHFAVNNREYNRMNTTSQLSERALREVYLRGFKIAVKEGKPAFVMTSYNALNGVHTSENYALLTEVLRNEWGFDGAVMTDWRTTTHQWTEIFAGNNLKMPFGYPEELELTAKMLNRGRLTREILENNVITILKQIVKTKKFKNQDFGKVFKVDSDETILYATNFTGTSSPSVGQVPFKDKSLGEYLADTHKDYGNHDAYLIYQLDVENQGEYTLSARISTPFKNPWYEVSVDDVQCLEYKDGIDTRTDDTNESAWDNWVIAELGTVPLSKGEHTFKFYFHNVDWEEDVHLHWLKLTKK